MSYIKARIEELKAWKNQTKPNYELGLQLFINYSSSSSQSTARSLTTFKSAAKLMSAIEWLIDQLTNQLELDPAETKTDVSAEADEIIEISSDIKVLSPAMATKVVKLQQDFRNTQRELSEKHEQLKELTTDQQRFALLKSHIIPIDDKAMNLFERIDHIVNTGKDIPGKKVKKTKKKNSNEVSVENLKRVVALRSTIANLKRRIAATQEQMKKPLSAKESEKLSRLFIKQESTLESYKKEYDSLKQLV